MVRCLTVYQSALPLLFVFQLVRTLSAQSIAPGKCSTGTIPSATADTSYRWPKPNPGLVANVNINYSFPTIMYPLESKFTGNSLALTPPRGFAGGFSLIPASGSSFKQEDYVLTRIEVRKPGQVSEASPQVLKHSLEVALVHQQVGGGYYANVIIPFDVSGLAAYDPLAPIIDGATMPTDVGQTEPMVIGGISRPLDLNTLFGNYSFLNYWTTLPSNCSGTTLNARQLMRSAAVNIGYSTFRTFMQTLSQAPSYPPQKSPAVSWILNTCIGEVCTAVTSFDMSSQLAEAKQLQSVGVQELRERKTLMDTALSDLVNGTANVSELALKTAMSSKNDLQMASATLANIQQYTSDLQAQYDASNGATFDADAPTNSPAVIALQMKPSVSKMEFRDTSATAPQAPMHVTSLLAAAAAVTPALACDGLKMSPVDIDTTKVVDPATISPELREFIVFPPQSSAPRLQTQVFDSRVRVSSVEDQHMGVLELLGIKHPISYIDIIVPGEHAINGRTGDVEMQIVHTVGKQAVAVAVLFDVGEQNAWLNDLLQQPRLRGGFGSEPLSSLHELLQKGSTDQYYRYDGSLTTSPCNAAQWHVLGTRGHVSRQQVAALEELIRSAPGGGSVTSTALPRQRFHPSLVAFGTTHLISQVSSSGLVASLESVRIGARQKSKSKRQIKI